MTQTQFLANPTLYWTSCHRGDWMYEVLAQRIGVTYEVNDPRLRAALTACWLYFEKYQAWQSTYYILKVYADIFREFYP